MENGLKGGNGGKMENQMENHPKLDRAKKGPKMAQKWISREFSIFSPFLGHVLAIFFPCQSLGVFNLVVHFFSIPGFEAVFRPYRPDRNTSIEFAIQVLEHKNAHVPLYPK